MKEYQRAECVVIGKTKEQFGGLSNMASGFPLIVNGTSIRTTEALYQACRFPEHEWIQKSILSKASPMVAKWEAKKYRSEFGRKDWDTYREEIMRWCLRLKLASHFESFGELLASTGNKLIVEQSRRDNYWGAVAVGPMLIGENVLGQLLMELRRDYYSLGRAELLIVHSPSVPSFKIMGIEISVFNPFLISELANLD